MVKRSTPDISCIVSCYVGVDTKQQTTKQQSYKTANTRQQSYKIAELQNSKPQNSKRYKTAVVTKQQKNKTAKLQNS